MANKTITQIMTDAVNQTNTNTQEIKIMEWKNVTFNYDTSNPNNWVSEQKLDLSNIFFGFISIDILVGNLSGAIYSLGETFGGAISTLFSDFTNEFFLVLSNEKEKTIFTARPNDDGKMPTFAKDDVIQFTYITMTKNFYLEKTKLNKDKK